ncbi:MAG: HAD family hydrolase [Candidatus Hodarchaeota archaeon]
MDIIITKVVYVISQKKLTKKEIHEFWRSGRKFDEFLKNWGIFDINDFWRRFDEEDLIERKKMIENREIYLYEDAKGIINELKYNNDIKLGIISNTPASIANLELDLIDLPYDKIFHEIFLLGTEQQYKAKPQPDTIIEFMEKYLLSNENMFIIGDTDLDIQAGKNAKINTILIKRKHNRSIKFSTDKKPDYIIENLLEIKNIII